MNKYDFTLEETGGKKISLEDFKGKKLVVYFYPKDNTPGCTMEALEFTKLKPEFDKLNTVVLGISKDSKESHEKFTEKHDLAIMLLSDESEEVHEKFNVLKAKKMFGKDYMGVERSTFIFDEDGNLIKEYRKVKAAGHAEEVLNYIRQV